VSTRHCANIATCPRLLSVQRAGRPLPKERDHTNPGNRAADYAHEYNTHPPSHIRQAVTFVLRRDLIDLVIHGTIMTQKRLITTENFPSDEPSSVQVLPSFMPEVNLITISRIVAIAAYNSWRISNSSARSLAARATRLYGSITYRPVGHGDRNTVLDLEPSRISFGHRNIPL
jgi:hypothetical protein